MNGSIESIFQNKLKLIWNDLSFKTNKNKFIINKLNGEIVSGRLTAILGPSGSGKTTLIECIANRRKKGVSGNVCVKHTNR
jgi:ABC-type multidrug transport system ATPase subunit